MPEARYERRAFMQLAWIRLSSERWDVAWQDKFERPLLDLWEQGGAIIMAIMQLLDSETMVAAGPQPPASSAGSKGKGARSAKSGKR